MSEQERYAAGVIPRERVLAELATLDEQRWDLLDALNEVNLARAGLMNTLQNGILPSNDT